MPNPPERVPGTAAPEVAAIFADICAVSHVPAVNSVWRQIAAVPVALEWTWRSVRPLVLSADMDAARSRVARAISLPQLENRTRAALASADVKAESLPRIRAILATFLRGNLTNLIALTALRLRMDVISPFDAETSPTDAEPFAGSPAAQSSRTTALTSYSIALTKRLAAKHETIGDSFTPGLYLALAQWPGLLAALPEWLGPLYAPDAMRMARQSAVRAAETEAIAMNPHDGPIPAESRNIRPLVERFARFVIPEMIPVSLALDRLISSA